MEYDPLVADSTGGDHDVTPAETAQAEGIWADVPLTSEPLPSGLVTFVMTDIEGSTRLFRKLGDDYAALLSAHRALLRSAFGRHHGVELGTEGDSFLIAFPDSAEALAACLEAQHALATHEWPAGAEVRVRIGVHTGEATPIGHDYVSLALHQVARISSGAHGGQVLLSEATADDAQGNLPSGSSLLALGSFQLRGFAKPERLFQLRHPDLQTDYPPVRAIGIVAHNLPFLRSGFVGRADDRAVLADMLRSSGVVSVVGMGGVGKTRLAVQVAFDVMDRFADGAWLVELAALTDPDSVSGAVAATMRITEQPGRTTDELLIEALAHRDMLLILDNCEHLLDAVAVLVELMSQHCPHLVILTTSREPLDVEGEVVWRVGPLPVVDPESVHTVTEAEISDAVRLFVTRAALVRPGFELSDANAADVARIVSHLNGIPLAIELAAAALDERPLEGVLRGLTDRFALLTHGRRTAPGRHQTLRAALEWSLDLLGDSERRLFTRLAVFAGTGTFDAVAEVCADTSVSSEDIPRMLRHLVRASLVVADAEAPDRWTMLESMRELAALELEVAGESEVFSVKHRQWYLRQAEESQDHIGRRGHAAIMDDLVAERKNIRRAIDNAIAAGDGDSAVRMCVAMTPFWTSRGAWTEGIQRLTTALELKGGTDAIRTSARVALGNFLLLRGEFDDAERLFAAAEAAAVTGDDDLTLAKALAGTGYVAFRRSDLTVAQSKWEEALERAERAGDGRVAAGILRSLAIAAGSSGQQDRAQDLLERAMDLAQQAEDDQLIRLLLGSLGELHLWLGHYRIAEEHYGEALSLAGSIGDLSARPLLLAELGWVANLRGDPATAHRLAIEAAELAEDLGNPRVVAHAHRLRGEAQAHLGEPAEAFEILEEARVVAEGLGAPAELAGVLCSQAGVALEQLMLDDAMRLAEAAGLPSALRHTMRRTAPEWILGVAAMMNGGLHEAEAQFQRILRRAVYAHIPRHEANTLWGLARISSASGRHGEAADLHWQALELRRRIGDKLGIADSLIGLATAAAGLGHREAARLVSAAIDMRASAGAVATPREAGEISGALDAIVAAGGSRDLGEHATEGVSSVEVFAMAQRLVEGITGANLDDGTSTDGETRSVDMKGTVHGMA
ncbi:MAG: hypothetical protein HKO10_07340 [Acidimicrobiia bacterium]|nr:hypothetical protein [Acidimicrobiia bacterium]